MTAVFILASKCNLKCNFCICQGEKELPTKLIKSKLNQCSGTVIFTGGEPLLHKDINELCKYAKNKKLKVGVHTNGILLDKLDLRQVDFVNLPLDGTKEIHNRLRGSGYDWVIKALDKLKEKGVEIRLTTIATKINKHDLTNIPRIVKKYPIKLWRVFRYKDNHRKVNKKYTITDEESNKLKKIMSPYQVEFIDDIDNFGDWEKIVN